MTLLFEKQAIFSRNLASFIFKMNALGYEVSIREVLRTPEQQAIYVKSGKSKTANSKHLDALAFDCYLSKNGQILNNKVDYAEAAKVWKSLSPYNRAGYDWGWDWYHFEYSN